MKNMIYRPIHTQPPGPQNFQKVKNQSKGTSFSDQFGEALKSHKGLTLSKHAKERLAEREININENRWSQIEERVNEAKRMGVKESLVLLNDAALIVNAKNNTVITAMNRQEATAQIFTNINGTIVLE